MRELYSQICRVCGMTMMYVQRRGASGGFWICPICSSIRVRPPDKPEDNEDDDIFPPRPRAA